MDEREMLEWLGRECSASLDSCWLCDSLVPWNVVLDRFMLWLHETQPGKICLESRPRLQPLPRCDPRHTASMIVWLLRKHRCIDTLVLNTGCKLSDVAVPDSLSGLTSHLRHISIINCSSDDWESLIDVVGPIGKLESLALTHSGISNTLAIKLAKLLADNATSMRKVSVRKCSIEASGSDILAGAVSNCKELTEIRYDAVLGIHGAENIATLLRSTKTLQKFQLRHDEGLNGAFHDFMASNRTLTELHYKGSGIGIRELLLAIEGDSILKHLVLSQRYMRGEDMLAMEEAIGSLLANNRGLRSLTLLRINFVFGDVAAQLVAGLRKNSTLLYLDISTCTGTCEAVEALCDALKTNKTCSLKMGRFGGPIGYFGAPRMDREALSRTLNENNLYGRVQLEWTDHDVTGLAASLLLQPTQCSIDLELTTETLSCASFQYVCKALSSSHLARSLTVYLSKVMPGHLESLSDALKKNVSLKGLKLIEEAHESRGSAVRAADGLRFSTSVSNLEIKCISGMELDDVRRLKSLIAEARSLNAIEISSTFRFYSSYAYILSDGVLCNPFITSFHVSPGFVANPDTEFNEPLIRNNARLSRAARFVLRRNTGKLCAEAFELFRSKSSLIERVKAVSGMSDSDAGAAVKSAEQFLSDNYFFINQVVRDKLECLPGEGTQIDQLNRDCLRLITRYLKISDVIVK